MAYSERDFVCGGCGKLITRRAAAESKPLCAECGIAKSAQTQVQMHQRDGDAYERWLLATLKAALRRLEDYRTRKAFEDIAKELRGG